MHYSKCIPLSTPVPVGPNRSRSKVRAGSDFFGVQQACRLTKSMHDDSVASKLGERLGYWVPWLIRAEISPVLASDMEALVLTGFPPSVMASNNPTLAAKHEPQLVEEWSLERYGDTTKASSSDSNSPRKLKGIKVVTPSQ